MDKNSMSPVSGRILAENGSVVNIVDLLGGATPISGEVYDIDTFSPRSGRVIGEDGLLYSLAELLKNLSGGSSLAAQPHLWPTDGSEVDLGDGTFGRRWKRWAGAGPTSAQFTLTTLSPPNPTPSIIDCGGQIWSSFIPSSANAGFVILGGTADFKADGGPWYYSSFEIDQGGECRLFTQNLQPQEGMDVWVRYTKIS
jgi:hypothetical protein